MKTLFIILFLLITSLAYCEPIYTEQKVIDQITILEDGQMQIREATKVFKDGVEITKAYHRHVISPDAVDVSNEDTKVQSVINVIWTQKVRDDFRKDKK